MTTHKHTRWIGGFFAGVGMILTALLARTEAQWSVPFHELGRGSMVHSITNKGWGGHRDNGRKQTPVGFSYPAARHLKVYSGGWARGGWNHKSHSAGDGIWVMSRTNGVVNIAYGGNNIDPPDISSLDHDVSTYPEAYLGSAHHENWALSLRDRTGNPQRLTQGPVFQRDRTTYWPSTGALAGRNPRNNEPVVIWNYHWNAYKDGRPFSERVAANEFDALSEPSWASDLSEDDFPDVVGIQKAQSSLHNLRWTRRWAQYGHSDYDDFLIQETVIENVGSETQEEVYAAVKNRFFHASEDSWYEGAIWWHALAGDRLSADDWNRSTLAPNYLSGVAPLGKNKPAGLPRGVELSDRGHGMIYMHDGDQQKGAWPHNDWGGPYLKRLAGRRFLTEQQWVNEGYINHPDYFGVGVVDAFPPFNTYGGPDTESYVAPYDNPATVNVDESVQQPASATIWQFNTHNDFTQPDPSKDSDFEIYDALTLAEYPEEPVVNEMYTNFLTFGPWTLAPGEKAKFVIAYVGGMAAQVDRYRDYRTFAEPFMFAYMNLYNGKNAPITTFEARQQEIPLGEGILFDHFERAIQVYEWGYDVPNQPPNIRLSSVSNRQGQVELRWSSFGEDATDPDYVGEAGRDIVGYRLYKGTTENEGPYELVTEFSLDDRDSGNLPRNVSYDPNAVWHTVRSPDFPDGIPLRVRSDVGGDDPVAGADVPGMYAFTDTDSKAGFPNWYYVRMVDSGHDDWKGSGPVRSLESAPGPAATGQLGRTVGVVPVVPSDALFNRLDEQIAVVPNPYKIDSPNHSYQGQKTIRFINLPSRAQIDIYDVIGQRVWTQFNDNPDTGESTWLQQSEGSPNAIQGVSPGVYFWKVTSLMPESMNETQTGTILVIK